MNTSTDYKKKELYESIESIAKEDSFDLLFHLMRELYQRREFCRAATEMKMNRQLMDISIIQLESHNERIKKLLKF